MIIIDGHNLLWYIKKNHDHLGSITDIQLSQLVGKYLKLINQKGQIVFDGTGCRDTNYLSGISNLEVIFSGANSDADTVIESKIKISTSTRSLTIVSSDRRIRNAAKSAGARSLKSEDFWTNLQKRLARKKTIREPAEKRSGLDEASTKQWLKYFGLEQ